VLGFLIAGPGSERFSPNTNVALAVGFLGAFTTFSTFTYETWTMLRTDRVPAAAAYVVSSVVLGLIAAALGYLAGRATV
jgi:CrcB protein